MKKTKYICNECKDEKDNIDGWLEISGEDDTLSIRNDLIPRKLRMMNKHDSIHFCSVACFIHFFCGEKVSSFFSYVPTVNEVHSACLSFRHDFGILSDDARRKIISEAQEWLNIWQDTIKNGKEDN
jgi:hypothetical protein